MARQSDRRLLRLLDTGLPLSILLINFLYAAFLASKRPMPPIQDLLGVLAYSGAVAVIAGSVVGVPAAIDRRSLLAGRTFFVWSFIGTFLGSITGIAIADWLAAELILEAASRDVGPGGFIGVLIIYIFGWFFGITVGFIWGYICAAIHTRRRSSMLPKPSP